MEDLPEPLLPMSSTFFFFLRLSILTFAVRIGTGGLCSKVRDLKCHCIWEGLATYVQFSGLPNSSFKVRNSKLAVSTLWSSLWQNESALLFFVTRLLQLIQEGNAEDSAKRPQPARERKGGAKYMIDSCASFRHPSPFARKDIRSFSSKIERSSHPSIRGGILICCCTEFPHLSYFLPAP